MYDEAVLMNILAGFSNSMIVICEYPTIHFYWRLLYKSIVSTNYATGLGSQKVQQTKIQDADVVGNCSVLLSG